VYESTLGCKGNILPGFNVTFPSKPSDLLFHVRNKLEVVYMNPISRSTPQNHRFGRQSIRSTLDSPRLLPDESRALLA
jgi:hypothetical protein